MMEIGRYYVQRFTADEELWVLPIAPLKSGGVKTLQVRFYGGRAERAKQSSVPPPFARLWSPGQPPPKVQRRFDEVPQRNGCDDPASCSCEPCQAISNGPRGGKKKRPVATDDDAITVLESLEAAIVDSGDPDATRIYFDTDEQWDEAQAEVRRGYARVVNKTKHTLELQITERGYKALIQRNGPKRSRQWIADAVKRPGKLGGRGFLDLPEAEQQRVLFRCANEYGTRSCLGSVMLLERIAPARHRARLARLHSYLAESHRRGYTPNPNPDDGSWDAIPIIIVPIDLRGATLTRAQVAELEQLTL